MPEIPRLMLHKPSEEGNLIEHYRRAFAKATELFIITAFLTDWDKSLRLNDGCQNFKIIIGKDFGITRKSACNALLEWLPSNRKHEFLVADQISGFHPKAIFWREPNGRSFAVIGSSNLTRAAFKTNYEANFFSPISPAEYEDARRWINCIQGQCRVVSEGWVEKYQEAQRSGGTKTGSNKENESAPNASKPTTPFSLPRYRGMAQKIADRRMQLAAYATQKMSIENLFRQCASGEMESAEFYDMLPQYWSYDVGDRLQGPGWELLGKHSNFQDLSSSFVKIIDAASEDRDDVVVKEIDRLSENGIPTRKSFLSEMLCLRFPSDYPVLNKPVQQYLKEADFPAPSGASEGVRYIYLAKQLRAALIQNKDYPAKNLAELDIFIWEAAARSGGK